MINRMLQLMLRDRGVDPREVFDSTPLHLIRIIGLFFGVKRANCSGVQDRRKPR